MAAVDQDFEIYAGDSATVTIAVVNPNTQQAKDLSGAIVVWRAINRITCEPAFAKTNGNGLEISNPAYGLIQITITANETKDLSPGRYDHAATVRDGAGDTCTVTVGTMTVKTV